MAAIRVPCWYDREEPCKRQPRWFEPRGTLRGGPERSAKDPQLPRKKIALSEAKSGRRGKQDAKTRPGIITVDESGEVRN